MTIWKPPFWGRIGPSLLALTLIAGVLPTPAEAQAPAGEKVALLVGVCDYDHVKFENLKYPARDVGGLGNILQRNGYTRITLLTSGGSREPTADNIRRELKALLARRTKRDTVLIALSGHGLQLDDGDSYFCPTDANSKDTDTLISLSKLYRDLDDAGAGMKLLLVDACRNDPTWKGAKGVDGDNLPKLGRGTAALFSCSPSQRSFEHKSWGHGAFFYTVLEGLSPNGSSSGLPADLDNDGVVDFDELSRYVRKNVPTRVAQTIEGAEQTPNAVTNVTGLVPLVRLTAMPRLKPKPAEPEASPGGTGADMIGR